MTRDLDRKRKGRDGSRLPAPGSRQFGEARDPKPAARVARAGLQPGQKLTVFFRTMNADGAAVAPAGAQLVAVPFAVPGEEALVEITRGGRRPEGKIVALLRKFPATIVPRCRHFGVCGGCQWQHLPYAEQLKHKTQIVRDQFKSAFAEAAPVIRDAVGVEPWEYRQRIQATFALRQSKVVAGYYAEGDDLRIINVQECPIQHGENVRLLHAVRDVIAQLDWPVYDRASGRGLIRGVIGQVGFRTGEAMLVLCTTREIPDRMAFVRAIRDRILNLTSLLLSVQPARTPELLGRIDLLWGRAYLEDELAGLRLRIYPSAALPPNPRALPLWLDTIARALDLTGSETVVDVTCEEGLVPLALAPRAARVVGVAPDREAMHRAWENARLNGVDNCLFYTRAPAGVLAKLRSRGERVDAMVATSRGKPLPPGVFTAAAEAGAHKVVCVGTALSLLAADLRTAAAAGYRPTEIQPVDLLPQTSRIHCVAALMRT